LFDFVYFVDLFFGHLLFMLVIGLCGNGLVMFALVFCLWCYYNSVAWYDDAFDLCLRVLILTVW